ncbi:hypothetical protein [Streptomyces sp. DSM 40907]|uniref:hypothetical protein n=1 Tax=Streptomyces kutzneri TaxID=3051179 RepID=UPI0028D7760E|nr:hypothetical protein [Streptomyces sp. DSM 40907]
MAICVHYITLRPEADENEFNKFVAEELLPAARTFTERRAALHADRHVFIKGSAGSRTYLWVIDWTHQEAESDNSFVVTVGPGLKAKLDSFASHTFKLYSVVARSGNDSIVTPTLDVPDELRDPRGWLGEDVWNVA